MKLDYERLNQKREELASTALAVISKTEITNSSPEKKTEIAKALIEELCTLDPPEKAYLESSLVTVNTIGSIKAHSRKLGNLKLDIAKLMSAIAKGTLGIVGACSNPWTIPLAVLVLWEAIWSQANVELGEEEASVILSMWIHRDKNNTIPKLGLEKVVNAERKKYNYQKLTNAAITRALEKLKALGCIEDSSNDSSKWWLQEWVSVKYQ
jgi:hypothetical protein